MIDARRVVSKSADATLRIWDVESGRTLKTWSFFSADFFSEFFSMSTLAVLDRRRVISASWDQTLRVWDVDTGEVLATLKGHTGAITGVAVLDRRRVISASWDRTLRVWSTTWTGPPSCRCSTSCATSGSTSR